MLAFPDIKTCGNGQIGKKGCWPKKGMSGKLADIDVSARHVTDMSPTFPTMYLSAKPLTTVKLGMKMNTRCTWAGGTFFPVVLYVVSVFGSGGK